MNTPLNQETAAALGIIPWQRRSLIKTAKQPVIAVMIAIPPEDITHPLLQTMLASFQMPPEHIHVTALNETLGEEIATLQPKHLLILGEAQNFSTTTPTTITHSLPHLMQNPAAKRETYTALKNLGLY